MRNGKETTIRSAYAFNHNFMGRMRLMVLDAQTSQQLRRYKSGELDSDRFLDPKRKMQLNGSLSTNNKPRLWVGVDQVLAATPSDIERRKIFEFDRYRKLRAKGKITRQMRRYGERKEEKIEQDSDKQLAKL